MCLEYDTSQRYLYEIQVDLGLPSHTVSVRLVTVGGVDLQLVQEVMTASRLRGIIPCLCYRKGKSTSTHHYHIRVCKRINNNNVITVTELC